MVRKQRESREVRSQRWLPRLCTGHTAGHCGAQVQGPQVLLGGIFKPYPNRGSWEGSCTKPPLRGRREKLCSDTPGPAGFLTSQQNGRLWITQWLPQSTALHYSISQGCSQEGYSGWGVGGGPAAGSGPAPRTCSGTQVQSVSPYPSLWQRSFPDSLVPGQKSITVQS